MADWLEAIDQYCERTDASFFSEPLNAVTNAGFLIAAWLLWKRYKASGSLDGLMLATIVMIAVVGVGSGLFHTFANHVTMLADVIPILLFVLLYIGVGYSRLAGFGAGKLLGVYGLFFIMAAGMGRVPQEWTFNGSIAYAPCLMVLIGLAWLSKRRDLLMSAVLFFCALTFRSVDMRVCEAFPIGTHFLWHSMNGVLLYRLGRSVMRA